MSRTHHKCQKMRTLTTEGEEGVEFSWMGDNESQEKHALLDSHPTLAET